jgi:hypothetical protein
MLYTNPELDWSWCFYEAGGFINKGRKPRPVYCVHPETVEPPSRLIWLINAPVECLVIFDDLPPTYPFFADKQDERGGFGDFLGQFRQKVAASAQALRCEENLRPSILLPQRSLQRLHQRMILRVVA